MKIKLSVIQKILLSCSLVVLLVTQWFCLFCYKNYQREKQYSAAKLYGEGIATSIHLILKENVMFSEIMKNLYLKYHETFINDFDIICSDFINSTNFIKSVSIAPSGIIQAIYPITESQGIGFNVLGEDSVYVEDYQNTIDVRRVTVSGPHSLKAGGSGLIIRNPIYENGRFSAFSIVVVDWNEFVNSIITRLPNDSVGYDFAVWNRYKTNIVKNEYGYMFSNCDYEISKDVSVQVAIPSDTWILSIQPVAGWKSFYNMKHEILISSLLVLLAFIAILLRQLSNSKKLYEAQHDDLTGLLSRTMFFQSVEKLIKNNPDEKIALVAADIENFKVTNSIYGTKKCDDILKYLAECFKILSPYDLCTRIGSDHFVFVIKKDTVENDIAFIEKWASKISENAPVENVTVKYGYYGKINTNTSVNLLCDKALLAAKSILHNYEKVVANYDGPLSIKNEKSQLLESSFISALKNEDFKVWYQPKFDANTEELVGAEALVRWIKEDGTVISPAEFIHVFEDDGLIYKLDLYVFENVCKKIKDWLDKGYKLLPISVNISRTSLQHKNIIKEYERIISDIGIPTEYVPLEITESSTTENRQIKTLTEDLKETGFKIHMDDFGSGLSSLESLNLLPFDVVKLDKSLIDFIGTPGGEELLRHMVELLQFKNFKIIAEGVETKDQLNFLRKLNCDHIQGYYYAAPMPYEDFISFMRKKTGQ